MKAGRTQYPDLPVSYLKYTLLTAYTYNRRRLRRMPVRIILCHTDPVRMEASGSIIEGKLIREL